MLRLTATAPAPRRGATAVVIALALVLLAGCTAEPQPAPSTPATTAPEPTPAPTPTATEPAAPQLMPAGTAEDNLPLFAAVAESVWASPQKAEGRAYIDALVAAGFDKGAMQVTDDVTTIGNAVETLQFSVQWGQECLVGQVGPVTGTVVTVVTAALAGGGCLLGATRPIDW
ncbi:hypothetical protein [Microbacterium sp. zg-YB36]|uniref:DUF6993 domain-containing protein n=1 Tax=Microbacterium sp. zg-YB36 TaxID=2969407 RepID=UPI00214CA381|nr:hypothetical protein [Microbacterium sp. zg-YB36]MDL5350395.1 hypothetical protein [Microbacterium sp. zg-YB36]